MGPFSEIFANLESMNRAVSNALVESAKVYFLLFIFLIAHNVRVLDVGFIQGFWYFAEKKAKFCGIFRGKFAEKSADFAGKKSKFAEKSADFAGF